MGTIEKTYMVFVLSLLLATVGLGSLASWAFLYPETFNNYLPFYQLRPLHVSSALFWIISGGVVCILHFKKELFPKRSDVSEKTFMYGWIITLLVILLFYSLKKFGGREYWEFPPLLSIPLLLSWILLMTSYFSGWRKTIGKQPLFVWMWSTGILFFLITFIEQNLWNVPWFRQTLLREITVQWKSNGSMVGAWNQMIYGSALFLMVKISGDGYLARSKKAFFFYFLGLANLMFNWGHHIYNVPTAGWIRHVSYAISMTEWLIFISIVRGFKQKLDETRKFKYLTSYKFLLASEFWIFANLFLALFMSIPAINRYTHGTHITVAHAMGTTVGINTMILLGAISCIIQIDALKEEVRKRLNVYYWITQFSLTAFWLSLIGAGILKGYRNVALRIEPFQELMKPVLAVLEVFAYSGIGLMIGIGGIAIILIKNFHNAPQHYLPPDQNVCVWKNANR